MRFCLACPRWTIGAFGSRLSMSVAKFVMSSASPDTARSNSVAVRTASRRPTSTRTVSSRTSIASQNRRWSVAAAGSRTHLSAAVVAHQSAKASFEQGATTRFVVANAK